MGNSKLKRQYDLLWEKHRADLASGELNYDAQLDDPTDRRFGISLRVRPEKKVLDEIQDFCTRINGIEPNQYFYPPSDVHITVLSIISCYEGFALGQINVAEYIETIAPVLNRHSKFQIQFEGITASESAVLIQGFPAADALENLRNDIRQVFKATMLEHSIDSRYRLETAHATVIRFKEPLANKQRFLHELQMHRHHPFGVSDVTDIELVFNDWYQSAAKVRLLKSFKLPDETLIPGMPATPATKRSL